MHGASRKRSGSRVLAFCRQHPDKMLGISTPYTCQETTDNFLFTPQALPALLRSPVLSVLKILFQVVSCIHGLFLRECLHLFLVNILHLQLLQTIQKTETLHGSAGSHCSVLILA